MSGGGRSREPELNGLEILTVAEMAAADRAAVLGGVASFDLMRRAGQELARAVDRSGGKRSVAVLCGPGLNGGDGYVAASLLATEGWPVRVFALADPTVDDAREARALWTGPVEPLGAYAQDAQVVVDALFGAGLSRPLSE